VTPPQAQQQGAVQDLRLQRAGVGGETYAQFVPNPFYTTLDQPLSTFGADVDTASFSNIRRYLSSGQLPPAPAVRLEELVNYFHFPYASPRDGQPIALTTEIGECPWAPTHKLALIGAKAAAPVAREITGRNIVLLIDVSGSMQPQERLPLLKTAFALFADTLRPTDTVAIVTYAGTSGVALPATPARQRDVIQNAIASLTAGGSTNGGQGLILAYQIARQSFIRGGVNRVILATDGDFNVGVTSQSELLQLIEHERQTGVFLSVLGVGSGNLKDATMEMLADRGNGHYAYLDSLQEARRVLVREGDATLETVAKDVKFQVEFNPAVVSKWKLLGYETRALAARDFNDDRKDAGEMGAGHTVTVLYEIVPVGVEGTIDPDYGRPEVDPLKYQPQPIAPRPAPRPLPADASGEWFTVKARYKLPEGDTSALISRVARLAGPAQNLTLASAIVEFGLILRDDPRDTERWDSLAYRLDRSAVPPGLATEVEGLKEMVATARGLARIR
jgi:Ca-activated chloride channel family protein